MKDDDNEYKHLNESAREALKLSNEERIAWIRGARWVGYTRAKEILDQLEDLLTHLKKHRMLNLLIYGDTNNGKTMIVNCFHNLHPAYDNSEGNGIILSVLIIQCPCRMRTAFTTPFWISCLRPINRVIARATAISYAI
ncbi:MAG: TniB family NTP-binding protein [Pyrinomonadaceae bacterium]